MNTHYYFVFHFFYVKKKKNYSVDFMKKKDWRVIFGHFYDHIAPYSLQREFENSP